MDFDDLFRTTYPRVKAYARTMASPADADDVVAEVYAIAWRRQHDIPRGAALGWLIGVTRRVLANTRRGERRVAALRTLIGAERDVAVPDPADQIADPALRAALLSLAPLDREAVILTAWFDLSSADAAQALGITPAAFRMRTTRARRRLRAQLATTNSMEHPQWTTP